MRSKSTKLAQYLRITSALVSCWLMATGASAATAPHTQATLNLSADNARPGETILAGIQLEMDPGWHTYWQNPGASGMPTTIDWDLPPGITAGKPEWPIPEKLPDKDLTTYIYKDKVLVIVPLTISKSAQPGRVEAKAKLSWLECEVQCVPGRANVQAGLTIGDTTKPSAQAELLEGWQKKMPKADSSIAARANWESASAADLRNVIISWNARIAGAADFFPNASEDFEVQPDVTQLAPEGNRMRISKPIKKLSGNWPTHLSGLLVQGSGANRVGYLVDLDLGTAPGSVKVAQAPAPAVPESGGPSLWQMLAYAFLGGLILNVMPCVLPVIALKILGFVGQSGSHPGRARFLGMVYAGGVLASFLVLAGLVLGLKAAGHRAGWGVQFSSPYFLVGITTLVTLIALNLFGVFEVHLGGRTMNAAANLSAKEGAAGAFFNGLLATVLATSCTAPFLGAAVGFAFAPNQAATTTIAVFLMVGVGLAFPYVLLTWQPGWLKFLPKPGLWMERFKVAMGFPMLAAAVWLFSLVSVYYGDRSWWLAIFLVMVAIAAWIYGEFVQRHRARPGFAAVAILLVLGAGYGYALENRLQWRSPITEGQSMPGSTLMGSGVAWKSWTADAVKQAQSDHRTVLVDFTAKWCLTCNTIVKPALESSSVQEKLKTLNAVALVGDYTRFPQDIADELTRHGRAGVPLVLVYPPDPGKPAIVLPEALTPGMVVDALSKAQM